MPPRLSIAIAIAFLASPLGAQVPPLGDTAFVPARCLGPDGKPPRATSLVQLVPGVGVAPFGPPPEAAEPSIDLASEVIARYMRTFLGAADGELPALDTTRSAVDYSGFAMVIARRDGSMRTLMPWDLVPRRVRARMQAVMGGQFLTLLERAVDSASANEPFTWPEKLEGDSVAFELHFDWPRPDGAGKFDPIPARHAAPVAPMIVPAVRAARPTRAADFVFRRWPADSRGDVVVEVEFVVDSTGRADAGSIRTRWPEGEPPAAGLAGRSFAQFTRDLERSIEGARYSPARVGQCLVRAPFRQRYRFAYGQ